VSWVSFAFSQAEHVVVVGSEHKVSVGVNISSTFQWGVYLDANGSMDVPILNYDFKDGKSNTNSVEVKWNVTGVHYMVVTETGGDGCETRRFVKVDVVDTPTIAFEQLTSEDCPDDDKSFATVLVAKFDAGNDLSETNYPLTVTYRITGETGDRTANVQFVGKLLHIDGIVEDINIETVNQITIKAAVNKYGGMLNVVAGQDIHTRTIFKKPVITAIELN